MALLAGLANVVFATAYQVYLPSLVSLGRTRRGQRQAARRRVGGRDRRPRHAGLAAQVLGAATALLFNAASFGVSAACLLRIRPVAPPPARAGRARIWPGVTFVARDPYLRPLTIYAAAANLAYTGNLALVIVSSAGMSPTNSGGANV